MKANYKVYFLAFFAFVLLVPQKVYAQQDFAKEQGVEEIMEVYDFDEIQKQLKTLFPEKNIQFTDLVKEIMQGNIKETIVEMFDSVLKNIRAEIGDLKGIFVFIISIGLLSAFFTSFSKIFENHQIADISYYLLYLYLIVILLKTFSLSLEICKTAMENIILFIKIAVPTFYIAIGISGAVLSATFFYQIIIIIIFGVESILLSFVIPVIYAYVFLAIINGITEDDKFSGIAELLKKGIQGILKVALAVITGLGVLQTIITPVIDSVKMNTVTKVVAAIPGIGNIANSLTEMVLGSAVLIKNSIGTILLLLLVSICFIPILKLILLTIVLKGSSAVIGIVCDKRMEKCTAQVGEGNALLLKTLITSMALFLITVAIISMATTKGY